MSVMCLWLLTERISAHFISWLKCRDLVASTLALLQETFLLQVSYLSIYAGADFSADSAVIVLLVPCEGSETYVNGKCVSEAVQLRSGES